VGSIATVVFDQRGLLQRLVDCVLEHRELDGFLYIVPRAQLKRADRILEKTRPGHNDDGKLGRLLLEDLQDAQSVEVGHA